MFVAVDVLLCALLNDGNVAAVMDCIYVLQRISAACLKAHLYFLTLNEKEILQYKR